MTTAIAAIDAILFLLAALWAIILRQKQGELDEYKYKLSKAADELLEIRQRETKKVLCTYRFSESDYVKPRGKMVQDAKDRVAGYIGRRIVKEVGLEEMIEGGAMVGYKIEIDVRKPQQ